MHHIFKDKYKPIYSHIQQNDILMIKKGMEFFYLEFITYNIISTEASVVDDSLILFKKQNILCSRIFYMFM